MQPIIEDIQAGGAKSLREIAIALNERGIPTARGGQWGAVQVQRVLNRFEENGEEPGVRLRKAKQNKRR